MSRLSGFVLPALAIGLGSLYIKPKRGFFPAPATDPKSGEQRPAKPLVAQVTLEEIHRDELEITEHPVERGAAISDHAYKRPAEVIIRCGWSDSKPVNPSGLLGSVIGVASALSPAARVLAAVVPTISGIGSILSGNSSNQVKAIYQQLLELQASATLVDIYTGKRVYKDMLFKSIMVTTDKDSENSLALVITCRQVILTSTRTVKVPVNTAAQAAPQKTTPVENTGNKQLQAPP